jgi:hypothetical protein
MGWQWSIGWDVPEASGNERQMAAVVIVKAEVDVHMCAM